MIQVPVTRSGNSDYEITLEGETFTIQYRYNSRNSRIFMNILKDGEELLSGLRLIENSTLNLPYKYEELPQGVFFLAQLQDDTDFATLGNVGLDDIFSLIYLSESEVIRP